MGDWRTLCQGGIFTHDTFRFGSFVFTFLHTGRKVEYSGHSSHRKAQMAERSGTQPGTSTVTETEDKPRSPNVVLKLRKPKTQKEVKWEEGTVDNEFMDKKKSKCCCIYEKPRLFGESSSDESDDDHDCTNNCRGHKKKCFRHNPDDDGAAGGGSGGGPSSIAAS